MIGSDVEIVGRCGRWRVEDFYFAHDGRMADSEFYVPAGRYKRLVHEKRGVVMNNFPHVLRLRNSCLQNSYGSVFLSGLGLGLLVDALLERKSVEKICVVEIDADVISLCGSKYANDSRVCIFNANVFDYFPSDGEFFQAVWHDVWETFWIEEKKQAEALCARWKKHSNWQGAWGLELMQLVGKI